MQRTPALVGSSRSLLGSRMQVAEQPQVRPPISETRPDRSRTTRTTLSFEQPSLGKVRQASLVTCRECFLSRNELQHD